MAKKRVTGIGGIFFKSKTPDDIKHWYGKHLGLNIDKWGSTFPFRQDENPNIRGYLQWSVMDKDSNYFDPSRQPFMINYRVEDLEWLVGELKKEGVTIVDEIESYEYGKFVHILDPDGNKIELWEPVDSFLDEYEKTKKGNT